MYCIYTIVDRVGVPARIQPERLPLANNGKSRRIKKAPGGGKTPGALSLQHQAEKLKVKFGAALADEVYDDRIVTIPGLKGHDPKEISEKNLAESFKQE